MDPRPSSGPSRRRALATLASGAAVAASGCVGRIRTMSGWEPRSQVTLDIKAAPADEDPYALRVGRQVVEWYRAAGIDAQVTPVSEQELFRQVLLNREFDLFVAQTPTRFERPDSLYSLLHSRFVETPGWQNPFGYSDLDANELLETQRRTTGREREEAIARLQHAIARTQPFTVVAFPDDIRAARTDGFDGWRGADLRSPNGYLSLERTGRDGSEDGPRTTATESTPADGDRSASTLRVAVTDRRGTSNLNPLAVEFRRNGVLTGLLYDSMGYVSEDGTVEPWLAESWEVDADGEAPVARVRLRAGETWHDGEPITAEDVAFTYDLLSDTSLGSDGDEDASGDGSGGDGGDGSGGDGDDGLPDDEEVPSPRFQGRISLVEEARAVDDRHVEVRFVECTPGIAVRALTVPVLPEHVWSERTDTAALAGIEIGSVTDALVTNNIPPVGSGPLRFVGNTPRESLTLERFDDHFLVDAAPETLPEGVDGPPAFDRFALRVVGSGVSAVGVVTDGDADVTGTPVGAGTVPQIGRSDDTDLIVDGRTPPYVVGYNALGAPLSNPQFRHTLARLIDRPTLVDDVFDGYARASVTPLAGTDWVPEELEWDGVDPVTPFLGSDGEVDPASAMEAFETAGYSYDDGRLVRTD
ncbi:ABC transporter substrate-binding protein [Halobaculum magnesiiphilum]|uniref:ABC transporter substrate-binding protein n=1 Tax=Halobaculum magnesiiphilum TaxID=1017351 RepID=A0A8T8WA86_9EURY|nr:ABC transporter substrate-binding protein [Halobaculum magnesiiphilum]QZP36769.1 ABC transporter substrate-binding protein [Halobaculum magnesiiphilum]